MYKDYVEELLKTLVTHFYHIYGNDLAVYNVHCLVHFAKDAKKYGSLEHISSFPFEIKAFGQITRFSSTTSH